MLSYSCEEAYSKALTAGSEALPEIVCVCEALHASSEALPAGSKAHPARSKALPAGSVVVP